MKYGISICALSLCLSQVGMADVNVTPQKGQSEQQISKDKNDCYQAAKKQTGIDPSATAQEEHRTGRTAAKGAVAGTAVGAISGNAGKGAAIGAGAGAVAGHHKKKKAEKETEQSQGSMAEFNSAESSCLKAKGYGVS